MVTTFDEIRHLPVLDAAGEHLGHVADLQLDPDDWQIQALVIRLERGAAVRLGLAKFLGASELALRVLHIHAIGDAVLLRATIDELAQLEPAHPDSPDARQ